MWLEEQTAGQRIEATWEEEVRGSMHIEKFVAGMEYNSGESDPLASDF